jgi:hypothetical protein
MTLALSTYKALQSNIFVRVETDYYKATSSATPANQVWRFSDLRTSYTINGESYVGIGNLMGITTSSSELQVTGGELTISISGIPDSAIAELTNSRVKGSSVRIYRVLFDAVTGAKIDIEGNPMGRYRGYVNNYSISEDYDIIARTSSNTISLICTSSIDLLGQKTGGRKTNPESQKKFYPTDLSMDRVPTLENATFDFGAPK